LWADGACEWRVLPGEYRAAPPVGQHSITGEGGFIREDNSPYTDLLMPIESIAVLYANTHGAKCLPAWFGRTGNEYVTLER
ncbi:MAG: hypothetical protein ACOCX4_08675, partial [Planctomycetota bacterium]